MKVLIDIDMGNAAFENEMAGVEVARILREVSDDAECHGVMTTSFYRILYDVNGNRVGIAQVRR